MAFTENDLSALSNMLSTFKENLVDDLEEKLETTIVDKLENQLVKKLEATIVEQLENKLVTKLEATIDEKLEAALLPVKEQLDVIDIRLGTVEKKITFLEAQQTTIILALDQMNQRLTRVEEKVDRLETKVDALETRMDRLESRMDGLESRMGGLESRMDGLESRMDGLEADVHAIKVDLLENNIIPRLNEIESCYLGTYKRYQESAQKAEAYFADTEMLKKTVEKHSEQLRKLA